MITDIISNKKLNQIVTELLVWGRKRNISIVFITKFYFPDKRELQEIVFKDSSDMNLCKECVAKPFSFLVINTAPVSNNPLCFR